MGATTATGTEAGPGASNKPTTTELAIQANGPKIVFTGIVDSSGGGESPPSSPPAATNTVSFPYSLIGGMDKYVILLTSVNGGDAYVSDRDEDEDGNFIGFSFVSEVEGLVMYLVAEVGVKPNILI